MQRNGINIYDVMGSTVDSDTNSISIQTGDAVNGTIFATSAEHWSVPGLLSLPSNPQSGTTAAQVVAIEKDDQDIVIGHRDLRSQNLAGNLKAGETCLYAGGSDGYAQSKIKLTQDGRIVLGTTDNNVNTGNSVYLEITGQHFKFVAPFGVLLFDATGFHVLTNSGASFDLGAIGGLPGPLSSASSYATIAAAVIGVNGGNVNLGPGPVYQPIVSTFNPIGGTPIPSSPVAVVGAVGSTTVSVSL